MAQRCVVLDDYQKVAHRMADWSIISKDVDVQFLHSHLGPPEKVIEALRHATMVCLTRERTALPRRVIEALPNLKLIVTAGMYNASVDLEAAKERGVLICGTGGAGAPTAELAVGLMLDLARNISIENARMKAGEPWQVTVGKDLAGLTLGLIGLGKLGAKVAKIAQAFDMKVVAWSQNMTPERAKEHDAEYVSKDELFSRSDFVSIHVVLSQRTRGLVGAAELARMKPSAYIINTSRGPIVDEAALLAALRDKKIAGAGVDVYDVEPLPIDHPYRKLDNVVMTPHLGYVTENTLRQFFSHMVEDIRAWLDGKPVRIVTANK